MSFGGQIRSSHWLCTLPVIDDMPTKRNLAVITNALRWHELQNCNTVRTIYRQNSVLVDDKDSQYTESDWLTVQTAQKHINLHRYNAFIYFLNPYSSNF